LIVQKFGGSSVANATRIMAAARKAIRAKQAGHQVIVVVSARGDTTDELIELAREITENPPAREMDMLLSTGEQISISLLAMAIQTLGEKAVSLTGAQVGIVTDSTHTKARIRSISTTRMRRALADGHICIVAGFQGVDEQENITTLGRGGSDTTAVALAAVMKTEGVEGNQVDCEIYTDVDGVYTTDPRLVPEARKLDFISYDEMLELASVGAGVMHSRSIEFARKFDVPVMVRTSFSDAEGTWILPEREWMSKDPVRGAALVKDEARVAILNVPDRPGISHKFFTALASKNIVVDMIAQNVSRDGITTIGFTVPMGELKSALAILQPLASEVGASLDHSEEVSKVSIVGVGMRTHSGVAQRMFDAIAAEGINLRMITTADIKISVLVDRADGIKALRAVHHAFDLGKMAARNGSTRDLERHAATGGVGNDLASLGNRLANMEDILVTEVTTEKDQGRIAIFNLEDRAGICSRIFTLIAKAGIVVDMIVQNLHAVCADLSFSVPSKDLARALSITEQWARAEHPGATIAADPDITTVHVHGIGMRTHTGVASRMFGTLASLGININMINTSEMKISVVVDRDQATLAVDGLKQAFGLS